jgi:hypothetical protein
MLGGVLALRLGDGVDLHALKIPEAKKNTNPFIQLLKQVLSFFAKPKPVHLIF